MRKRDKIKNIQRVNMLMEQRYFESTGLAIEERYDGELPRGFNEWRNSDDVICIGSEVYVTSYDDYSGKIHGFSNLVDFFKDKINSEVYSNESDIDEDISGLNNATEVNEISNDLANKAYNAALDKSVDNSGPEGDKIEALKRFEQSKKFDNYFDKSLELQLNKFADESGLTLKAEKGIGKYKGSDSKYVNLRFTKDNEQFEINISDAGIKLVDSYKLFENLPNRNKLIRIIKTIISDMFKD